MRDSDIDTLSADGAQEPSPVLMPHPLERVCVNCGRTVHFWNRQGWWIGDTRTFRWHSPRCPGESE